METGYTRTQIVLHWLIVVAIVLQWLTGDAMENAFRPMQRGRADFLELNIGGLIHFASGVAVLLLVLLRFGLRLGRGAPAAPAELFAPLAWLSKAVHWAFYLVLLLLPVSGLASVLVATDAAGPHNVLFNLLMLLVVLHLAGVLFHSVVLRDGLIRRMLVAREAGRG